MRKTIHLTYKLIRRITIFVVGMSVLIIGIIMFVTPGPAIVVIPIGLGILGIEFAWARHWLQVMKEKTKDVANKAGRWRNDRTNK